MKLKVQHINNLQLTIAGAGGGKTFDMVQKVKKHLLKLRPNRTLAVITYTNAATEEIKERLQKQIEITPNIFIGTIHSFLIQFIFEPYSKLLGISKGKCFYADEVFTPPYWIIRNQDDKYDQIAIKIENQTSKLPIRQQRSKIRKALVKAWKEDNAEKIINKNIFVHDKVLEKALEILKNNKVRNLVAKKLQFVFVDEYQDARVLQHDAFIKIHSNGLTKFFFVGDPLQSIYRFGYENSHNKEDSERTPASFDNIPIMQLIDLFHQSDKGIEHLPNNHRSTKRIREFVNYFQIGDYLQKPLPKYLDLEEPSGLNIYFINKSKKTEIVEKFLEKIKDLNLENESTDTKVIMHKLILTRQNATIPEIENDFLQKFEALDNQSIKNKSRIKEFHALFLNIIGFGEFKLVELGVSKLEQRKITIETLKYIKKLEENNHEAIQILNHQYPCSDKIQTLIKSFWKNRINLEIQEQNETEITNSIKRLLSFSIQSKGNDVIYYSSVHKAKGLEATCVLVLAESSFFDDLLNEWFKQNKTGLNDEPRIGYVAFSRARKLLCIASEKTITDETKEKLTDLNIKIIE